MTLHRIDAETTAAPASAAAGALPTDDAELASRALTNDPATWEALVARYERSIRAQLARTLAAGSDVLCSDSVDEALGDYWAALLRDDRAWLRRYDPSRGYTLCTWLTVLAWDVGNKHLRRLRRWRAGLPIDDVDLDVEPWNARGHRFLAFMETIQPDVVEKKPFFKWR